MNVPRTTPDQARRSASAAAAGGCPVDRAAAVPPEPADVRPVIPATELPRSPMHPLHQIRSYWKRPVGFLEDCRDRYGSRFALAIRLPPTPYYVVSDPVDIKQVFLAPADVIHTGTGSAAIAKYIGRTGLAWLDEDQHNARRKLLMPPTHGNALRRIEAMINGRVGQDVAGWPQQKITALHPLTHRLTLEVIGEVIFGTAMPARWDEMADLVSLLMMKFNPKVTSLLRLHEMPAAVVRLITAFRPSGLHRFVRARTRVYELLAEAVAERRAASEGAEFGDDLLGVLLGTTHEDGSRLDAIELRDEMMTIFLAGTETTASALAYAFEYLSREPDTTARLVAEIDRGESEEYLTAVVQEVLRLRPPIAQIILREVVKPVEIGGVRYEPGDIIWPSAHLLHHDPTLYPDPHAFRPERWLSMKPTAYTWIPFGGGRIRCLGAEVALVEMRAVIREVLARFELHRGGPDQEPIRSRIVITVPGNGGRVMLRPRTPAPITAPH